MDDVTWNAASAECAAGQGGPNLLVDAIPAEVRTELEALGIEGAVILGLAAPWLEAVNAAVTRFEGCAEGLDLTDSVHRRLGQVVGVERLYDLVGHLNTAVAGVS
jgi:hypothetical protein